MEVMLDRVTQIPTLFERHSQVNKAMVALYWKFNGKRVLYNDLITTISVQDYQLLAKAQKKINTSKPLQRKKKRKQHGPISSSTISYMDCENASRSDSGSSTCSASTLLSTSQSSKSSNISLSQMSEKSVIKSRSSCSKKKGDRSQLKVSINETAELIEDEKKGNKLRANESLIFVNESNESALQIDEHDAER